MPKEPFGCVACPWASWGLGHASRRSMVPRSSAVVLLLLLLARLAAGDTRRVTTGVELLRALEDPQVDTIQLVGTVGVLAEEWAPYNSSNPVVVSRNLTLMADPHLSGAFDANYNKGLIKLAPGVEFVFSGLLLLNPRYGSGVMLADILAYSPGSRFVRADSLSVRVACVPHDVALLPVNHTARLAGYPGTQLARPVGPGCVNTTCWESGVLYDDVTLSAALSDDPTSGGYDVIMENFTKACQSILTVSCLESRGADACVQAAIDAARNKTAPQGGGPSTGVIVGAVIGAVVGFLLLFGGALVVWQRRRRRRRKEEAAKRQQYGQQEMAAMSPMDPRYVVVTMPSPEDAYDMAEGVKLHINAPTNASWEIAAQRTSAHLSEGTSSGTSTRQSSEGSSSAVHLGVLLGAGSFGRVYKGSWMHRTVAVKVLRHSTRTAELVFNEVDLMLSFNHPNVVRALHVINWRHKRKGTGDDSLPPEASAGAAERDPTYPADVPGLFGSTLGSAGPSTTDTNYDDAQTWIVQEFCDGGSLADLFLTGQGARAPKEMLKLLCRLKEVAQALQYLHARHVVHGDLKVANVLLAADPTAPFGKTAKVTDFGLSRALQVGQTHRSTRTLGTVSHMAPELLRLGRMSSAADVYAFSIMMWEMVTGRVAFADMHYGEVVERVGIQSERPLIPDYVPEDYALLMRSCWAEMPGARPNFKQVEDCLNIMLAQVQRDIAEAATAAAAAAAAAASGSGGGSSGTGGVSPPQPVADDGVQDL